MSDAHDKKPDAKDAAASDGKRSGRVAFDSRGNSVWEWQVQTGVYSRDVNTENVRQLDLDELSLEDTAAARSLEDKPARQPAAKPELALETKPKHGGFNPYDNSPSAGPQRDVRDPYDNARLRTESLNTKSAAPPVSARPAVARKPPAYVKEPPRELRKLSGWLKLKQVLLGKRGSG